MQEFGRLPDEATILNFDKIPCPQHQLTKHKLPAQILLIVNELLNQCGLLHKADTAVDVTLITEPIATKNKEKLRDPEMHSSKKGNQWCFGKKLLIGVDVDSGLLHSVQYISGNISDIAETNWLVHGVEKVAFGDAGYQGVEKLPIKRRALNKENQIDALIYKAERLKAAI